MEEFLRSLQPLGNIRPFKKGSTLLFQGEIPQRALVILDGFVKAYSINSNGEESVVSFFCKGDVIPLPWLFGTSSSTLFYYDAATDVRVLAVSKSDFHAQLQSDQKYLTGMIEFQNQQYTSLLLRITGLEQSRAIEKVAFTLYYLMFRYGIEKTPGAFFIDMKLSQSAVANLVGITRESTTRNLVLLKKKGIITYQNSKYTIHKTKLENFIGEDGFRELSL
jgi:cAMP-binding proteins - catabolite gene activator and regulatory subunit of cAMP-dependent protein kinases